MVSRQREWQKKMQSQGRCIICGKPSTVIGYCDFHYQGTKERASRGYRKHMGERKRIIDIYIEETKMKEYFIREDKQGRCYISRVKNYEGAGGVGFSDVVMVYKTEFAGYVDGWQETAKKICDFLNAVVE